MLEDDLQLVGVVEENAEQPRILGWQISSINLTLEPGQIFRFQRFPIGVE